MGHLPSRKAGLATPVVMGGGVRSGPGVVVPWVLFTFTLFTLIRYVEVLLCWNTLVDIAKYQKIAKNTAILKSINAMANVALCRNRDVIFARCSALRWHKNYAYFCRQLRRMSSSSRYRHNPDSAAVSNTATSLGRITIYRMAIGYR